MATPNEIQVGRFNDLLHKLLSMKEGAPAPVLAPEIFAVLSLDDDRQRPERGFLSANLRFAAETTVAGVAAQFQAIFLCNPAASGAIVIVERIVLRQTSNVTYLLSITTAPAVTVNGLGLDTRQVGGGVQLSAVGLAVNNNAGAPTQAHERHNVLATSEVTLENPGYVLSPGFALQVTPSAQNTACIAGFAWRQRPFEPSETR